MAATRQVPSVNSASGPDERSSIVMSKSVVVVIATVGIGLGLSAPAFAADANQGASCSSLAGASRAGHPQASGMRQRIRSVTVS